MACLTTGGGSAWSFHTVNVVLKARPPTLAAIPALAIGAFCRRVECNHLLVRDLLDDFLGLGLRADRLALFMAFNGRIGDAVKVFLAFGLGDLPGHDLGPENLAHFDFQRQGTLSTLLTGLNASRLVEFHLGRPSIPDRSRSGGSPSVGGRQFVVPWSILNRQPPPSTNNISIAGSGTEPGAGG